MRNLKPKRTLKPGQVLSWLPVTAVAVLTIVLVAKWSVGNRIEHKTASIKVRLGEAIQPEMLLNEAVFEVAPTVQAGVWSMPGSSWNFENETVSTLQLSRALSPNGESTELGSNKAEHLSLIDLIPAQRAQVECSGSTTTRRINFGHIQANVSYREQDGQRNFISAKLANRIDAAHWQLITLSPKATQYTNLGHLIPMTGSVANVCQRYGKNGSLQCEILETDCSIKELSDNWTLEGWLVQPFSFDGPQENTIWNCTKESQAVHIRATKNATNSTLSLVVTAIHNL